MIIPTQKRHEYWNHFIERWIVEKRGGGNGITGSKLARIKPQITSDNTFWADVVGRHSGLHLTPEKLEEQYPGTYEHCAGNFWGVIMQTLVERKLVK